MAVIAAYPSPSKQLTTMGEWELYHAQIQWSGINATPDGGELAPAFDPQQRQIVIAPGSALIRGLTWETDTPLGTDIPAASSQDRIDRLVLRYDRTVDETGDPNDVVTPVVIAGTPGSSQPPAVQQTTDGLFDMHIARWTSSANGALLSLVDERDFFSTQGPVPCFSYARRAPGVGTLIYEVDTHAVRIGDGGAWRNVLLEDDSGKVTLQPSWPDHWSPAVDIVVYRRNGWIALRVSVTRKTRSLNPGNEDSYPLIVTLPAAYRPPVNWYSHYYVDGGGHGTAVIRYDDGTVKLAAGTTINVGEKASFSTTFPAT